MILEYLSVGTAFASTGTVYWLNERAKRRIICARRSPTIVNPTGSVAIGRNAVAVSGPWRPPAEIEPPASVPPRRDTFWSDVVGIPFDVWCALGSCETQIGYTFPAGVIAYLEARRAAGDFLDPPVDLVKPVRIVPEPERTPEPEWVGSELWLNADPSVSCPYCKAGQVHYAITAERYMCWSCERMFDAAIKPTWGDIHGKHGIAWKRIAKPGTDRIIGVCQPCAEKWTYDFATRRETVVQLRPRSAITGVYRDMDTDALRESWKRMNVAKQAVIDSHPMEIEPINPGLRRLA